MCLTVRWRERFHSRLGRRFCLHSRLGKHSRLHSRLDKRFCFHSRLGKRSCLHSIFCRRPCFYSRLGRGFCFHLLLVGSLDALVHIFKSNTRIKIFKNNIKYTCLHIYPPLIKANISNFPLANDIITTVFIPIK